MFNGIPRTLLDAVSNDEEDSDTTTLIINLNSVAKFVDTNTKVLPPTLELKFFGYWL